MRQEAQKSKKKKWVKETEKVKDFLDASEESGRDLNLTSRYGRRLKFKRSWVQISAPYLLWIHIFHINML